MSGNEILVKALIRKVVYDLLDRELGLLGTGNRFTMKATWERWL